MAEVKEGGGWPIIDTGDAAIPGQRGYPVCETCEEPYAWRWCISIERGVMFAWFCTCKHKTAGVRMVRMPAK